MVVFSSLTSVESIKSVCVFSVRGSDGTSLLRGPPECEQHAAFTRDPRLSRCVTFSRDGTFFGWCNGHSVSVVRSSDGSIVSTFDLPKTALLEFSPLNKILITWQPYNKSQDSSHSDANLQLWELQSGQLIKALYQKKVDSWCPRWSEDEKLSVRSVNNELHFYENNDFNTIANKLHMQKVSNFALSPGGQPSKVAVYVPGSKGAPSFVRLYQYPVFGGSSAALANKSFFKADKVTMQWNKKASAVLVMASTEVDKTGASYYGEQTLHYLAVNGETALVQLPKNGPIYDVVWSPNSSEFCVVYGFMPAKATIFNLKCDPTVLLPRFRPAKPLVPPSSQVAKPQAPDATHFSWSPDGEYVVTATCSPRLRVSNGYKIWHYTGSVVHKWEMPSGSELWEVLWQPFPDSCFPERPVKYQATPSDLGTTQALPTQVYRPPALRHLPATASSKLHEEEPPQNMRPGVLWEKSLSKSALKNQRKREAKKAAKQELKPEPGPPLEPATITNSQSEPTSGDPETDKKIKNLKKKLKAIEELREQQVSGKVLQKNQVTEISGADLILQRESTSLLVIHNF
uniref:Eukaryotic translation initiation factor 2A n=1 Tax=Echeneis naucrates TaxID=173247 RepID=A0A665U5X3_ECHNA